MIALGSAICYRAVGRFQNGFLWGSALFEGVVGFFRRFQQGFERALFYKVYSRVLEGLDGALARCVRGVDGLLI